MSSPSPGSSTIAALLAVFGTLSVAGQQSATAAPLQVSLEAAVERVLSHNPRSIQAAAGEEIAVARLRQERSRWLPLVQASQTYSRGDHPVFVFGSLLEQGRFGAEHFDPAFLNDPPTLEHYRLALDLKLPIFDQFQRISSVSQAKLGLEESQSELTIMHQQLRLDTLRAYYGALIARRALDVARQAVVAAEADVDSIRDRYETGLLAESDLLAAEVQLAEFRQQQISASGAGAIATAALRALLALPADQPVELTSDLPHKAFSDKPLEDQLRTGLADHPEIIAAGLEARATELDVRKARARYLPRLDGFASFATSGSSIGEDLSDDHLVGLQLSLDIFQPGRNGAVAEARARQRAAEAEVDAVTSEITLRIVSAWEELQSAIQRVDVAERSLSRARESVRIIRDRYQEGLVTITEQLRAQTAVTRAELNHLSAIHDMTVGHALLLRAAGRLHDVEAFIH